jgi:uncharacterized protein (DUF1697 family)
VARTHVALLRAINVGGRNSLPMKDLAKLCEAVGCRDVKTYIQSGNVAFSGPATLVKKLPVALAGAIKKHSGLDVPVIVRDVEALRDLDKANPYVKAGAHEDELYVGFLAGIPTAAQIAACDPKRSPPDELVVRGGHVYFRFPKGAGQTKYTTTYLDAKLGSTITMRNLRTLRALIELCS